MPVRTKKLVCRILFLLVGLVPLLSVVGYASWRQVVFDRTGYQTWVASHLGLDLRIQEVSHPVPHVIRFTGANIVDPETNKSLARCDELTVKQSEQSIGLQISSVNVAGGEFRRLIEVLHERLLRQSRLLERSVFLVAQDVTLVGENRRLVDLRMDAERGEHGPQANVTFGWADRPDVEPVRLELVRDQLVEPAVTRVRLQTGDASLPCSLLCRIPDDLAISDAVTFQGIVNMVSSPRGWTGDLSGNLTNLVFEENGQQLFTGTGQATIRRAVFEGSRMRQLDGWLTTEAGHVNRVWLFELIQKLGLNSLRLPEGSEPLPYAELGVDFRIDAHQADLAGIVGSKTSGVMLSIGEDSLVGWRTPQPLETVRLFRALFRLGDDQVPVSIDANPTLRLVPLP